MASPNYHAPAERVSSSESASTTREYQRHIVKLSKIPKEINENQMVGYCKTLLAAIQEAPASSVTCQGLLDALANHPHLGDDFNLFLDESKGSGLSVER